MTLDLKSQIRDFAQEFGSTLPTIDADELMTRNGTVVSRPNRQRPGWVVALAAVAVVLILVGSVAVMSSLFGEPRVADEPDPVTTTTVVSEDGFYLGVPLQPTRPFRATVPFPLSPGDGDPTPGDDPEVIISYAGPGAGWRADVVANDLLPGSTEPGSFLVFDGTRAGSYLADLDLFVTFPADEAAELGNLREFGWDLWAQRCMSGEVEQVSEEMLADRATTHVSCIYIRGAFDVWVDTETGVVMKFKVANNIIERPISRELSIFRRAVEVGEIDYEPPFGEFDFSVEAPPGADSEELASRVRGILVQNDMTLVQAKEAAKSAPTVTRLDIPAPRLSGPLLTGGTFDVNDLLGTNVVLVWWASWCAPSLNALEATDQIAGERPDIAFVGVNFQDQTADAQRVLSFGNITIPLVDTEGSADIPNRWSIGGCPTIALIDAEGLYTENHLGITTYDELATLLDDANW